MNQSGANFAKFENSQKIEDKLYDDNFFTDNFFRSTRSFGGAKKIFGVKCTLRLNYHRPRAYLGSISTVLSCSFFPPWENCPIKQEFGNRTFD